MRSPRLAILALLVAALVGAAGVQAAPQRRPTVERCLRAWNAPENLANRHRLAAAGYSSASLRPGVVGTDTFAIGRPSTSTSSQACLLTLIRRGSEQIVTGRWVGGRVTTWRYVHRIQVTRVVARANVRVRPDGRISLR
jgi:hypothetical protein